MAMAGALSWVVLQVHRTKRQQPADSKLTDIKYIGATSGITPCQIGNLSRAMSNGIARGPDLLDSSINSTSTDRALADLDTDQIPIFNRRPYYI